MYKMFGSLVVIFSLVNKNVWLLALIVMSLMSFSCTRQIIDKYSEDEIVRIMMDAHTLGLIYNRQEVKTDSVKKEYFKVLEHRYNLSQKDFQKLVEGLILNSELYDRIYKRLNDEIEVMERLDMEFR